MAVGVVSTLAMVFIMTLSSCNKNPMEVEIQTKEEPQKEIVYSYVRLNSGRIIWIKRGRPCLLKGFPIGFEWKIKIKVNYDALIIEQTPYRNTFFFLFKPFRAGGARGSLPTHLLRSDKNGYVIFDCWNCEMYGIGRKCSWTFPTPPIPLQVTFNLVERYFRYLKSITSNTIWISY